METSSKYLKHTGWTKWGWFCSGIWAETAQSCFDGCLLVLIVSLCFRLAGSCTSAQLQIQMLCSRENPLVAHWLFCKMGKSGGQPGLLLYFMNSINNGHLQNEKYVSMQLFIVNFYFFLSGLSLMAGRLNRDWFVCHESMFWTVNFFWKKNLLEKRREFTAIEFNIRISCFSSFHPPVLGSILVFTFTVALLLPC